MAKQVKQAGSDVNIYICVRHIQHDGDYYPPDEEIMLSADDAKPLLDCGAITESPGGDRVKPASPKKSDDVLG